MIIDSQASEKRELQTRAANINYAGQLMMAMVTGKPEVVENVTPEKLFQFAIGVADQIQLYLGRPFDEPGRLVS